MREDTKTLRATLEWIEVFAAVRSIDDSKAFARVNRAALRNISERARAALAKPSPALNEGGDRG